ncbi:putative sperm motility kinase W [Rattus norvegicus]|uniref:non-specific serine/threonine protein kinase n=1 Tax=Rattus norvegicus TaxID=10116 RepID=A0ABK0M4Z2_RAT|nr:putative sperm motility kinase W [Rattus norvegicus]|eukprot:XP_017452353.1 PREDICTED: putative sperm motility kinase W isoform X1 [Rattus norvegicus]
MASNSKKKTMESQYKVLFTLGKGSFGTVKLALHLKTEALVAIKTVELNKKTIRGILAEIATLETLHHPKIVSLFQILVTSRHINFITEYVPGANLFEIIKEEGPLQEEEAKVTFGQIVSAVKHCHSLDIAHRDIKPQNILRDQGGNVKLIDFGLATKCRSGTLLKQRCGTKGFYAPELIQGEPYDAKKTDVWSLGVLLYFIIIGYYPFRGSTMNEIEKKISTGTYDIPSHVSGQLENLIHQILTLSPEMRPSIEDIERHPWVEKCELKVPTVMDPDYNIIDMLCGMGFKTNEILESLQRKKYDEPMGAYLILKYQVNKGIELGSPTSAKPVDPCPAPPPSPAHPTISGLPLKRRASEPNFSLFHIRPSGKHGSVALALSGYKVARSVSMPPISPDCTNKKNSASIRALYSGPVADPRICSSILEDRLSVPSDQDSDIETSQNIGCVKRLGKSIRACLSGLCCPQGSEGKEPSIHPPRKWLP